MQKNSIVKIEDDKFLTVSEDGYIKLFSQNFQIL